MGYRKPELQSPKCLWRGRKTLIVARPQRRPHRNRKLPLLCLHAVGIGGGSSLWQASAAYHAGS